MIDPARIADAAEQLRAGLLPPPAELEALLAAAELGLGPHRHVQSRRRRDALLRRIAAGHYPGTTRARADRLSRDLRAYVGTSWPRDRGSSSVPARLRGTVQAEFWRVLKEWPEAPTSSRRLFEIIR